MFYQLLMSRKTSEHKSSKPSGHAILEACLWHENTWPLLYLAKKTQGKTSWHPRVHLYDFSSCKE